MDPVILEVAINGVTSAELNPAVPKLASEIAEDALQCFTEGAAIVHAHTADPFAPAEKAAELYAEAFRRVQEERPDAVLYPTIGAGDSVEDRYGHHAILAGEGLIRCGVLDAPASGCAIRERADAPVA